MRLRTGWPGDVMVVGIGFEELKLLFSKIIEKGSGNENIFQELIHNHIVDVWHTIFRTNISS